LSLRSGFGSIRELASEIRKLPGMLRQRKVYNVPIRSGFLELPHLDHEPFHKELEFGATLFRADPGEPVDERALDELATQFESLAAEIDSGVMKSWLHEPQRIVSPVRWEVDVDIEAHKIEIEFEISWRAQ